LNLIGGESFQAHLKRNINITLYQVEGKGREINSQFETLNDWIQSYLGPATAELNDIKRYPHQAIMDENRNAILPEKMHQINGIPFYLAVKGCGAYEDMFTGSILTPKAIKGTCHDKRLLKRIDTLSTGKGFIMAESWMGESPYGAQGITNAYDELAFSRVAKLNSINGAFICPVIGVVQLATFIENIARNFYWFRTYKQDFYQVIRLMPSNVRLYFESSNVISDPKGAFHLFGLNNKNAIETFELNFIRSGIALLSLFARSAQIEGSNVKGIMYQDVWLDKDCVVAPNGLIHFADLEGLIWKQIPITDFESFQTREWQKLVFEFLSALVKIDSHRHQYNQEIMDWQTQREELALLVELALNKDLISYSELSGKDLMIVIEGNSLPLIKIPFLEEVN
jgi:hypothetical protein